MRAHALAWLGLLAAPLLLSAPGPARADGFEDAVLAEINQVRAHPQAYARELQHRQMRPAGYGDDDGGMDQDDPEALDEAIAVLLRQPPLRALDGDARLGRAANDLVMRQGPRGGEGHGEPGALGRRVQAQGLWAGLQAEGISYGQRTPKDVVRQLIVDSGTPSRGHRHDILSGAYQAAGVACGPHARWGAMCVIDYAGAIQRR